jgi:homoserine kinase
MTTISRTAKVSLSVPATTANLGPMFDVAGIALSVAISVQVQAGDKFELNLSGLGSDSEELLNPATNMVCVGAEMMFDELGVAKDARPPLKWTIHSDVPTKAGLGSSSAAVVAGMAAANALCGQQLDHQKFLQLAARIEGHPDNAAPAIMGGMQIVFKDKTGVVQVVPVPLPPTLRVVVFTPTSVMKKGTAVNRGVLPKNFNVPDIIHNLSRTAVLLTALLTNTTTHLEHCSEEMFHQNFRAPDYPHFNGCMKAAQEGGASHTFMSGSGPSVGTFVMQPDDARAEQVSANVAKVMEEAAQKAGVEGKSRILRVHPNKITIRIE